MIEVLRNKNLTTRFQILVEIANSGPNIQQRDIANKLDITPQAVSDYIAQLIKDKMLTSEGRSSYKFIQRAVTNISICAALAESDLEKNQKVGLKMKDGLLFASLNTDSKATGITISKASSGEDVGITDIKGIVPLELGQVTIVRVPGIQRGGSRKVNIDILRDNLERNSFVTFLGLESFAALRKAGVEFHQYGAAAAAIEAAMSGLNALVVCVENETSDLIDRLEKEGIRYELIDAEVSS